MAKLDFTKEYRPYYTAKTQPELVDIEPAQYISIAGKGDPSAQLFADNIAALYATAYTIKFACKAKGNDFTVAKLEGLWWFDEQQFAGETIATAPKEVPRSEWEYRLLIRIPAFVKEKEVAMVVAKRIFCWQKEWNGLQCMRADPCKCCMWVLLLPNRKPC